MFYFSKNIKRIIISFCAFSLFWLCTANENQSAKSLQITQKNPFELSVLKDSIILGSGISLVATDFLCADILKLNRIELPSSFDKNNVPKLDQIFMNQYSKKIDYVATGVEIVSLLTPAILLTTNKSQWLTIGTMFAETFIWAYGLKDFGKFIVNRARPYMYFENYPEDAIESYDWANSFPSGHTTLSFVGASFTSYVFFKYFPSSNWKWAVSISSFALATTTGVLRMLSGNHFLTDVICGATIGTLCGFAVPFIHTLGKKNKNVEVSVAPNGFAVAIKL